MAQYDSTIVYRPDFLVESAISSSFINCLTEDSVLTRVEDTTHKNFDKVLSCKIQSNFANSNSSYAEYKNLDENKWLAIYYNVDSTIVEKGILLETDSISYHSTIFSENDFGNIYQINILFNKTVRIGKWLKN